VPPSHVTFTRDTAEGPQYLSKRTHWLSADAAGLCQFRTSVNSVGPRDHLRSRRGGLLAHIVVSKYDDHLRLYRRAEIFARDGVSLETSTLSGWVSATAPLLKPLVDALATDVLASDSLHVDHTGAGAGVRDRRD
jgi:transposase